jgi:hypothetical protein
MSLADAVALLKENGYHVARSLNDERGVFHVFARKADPAMRERLERDHCPEWIDVRLTTSDAYGEHAPYLMAGDSGEVVARGVWDIKMFLRQECAVCGKAYASSADHDECWADQ